VDHTVTFSLADERIWFRHYQIMKKEETLIEEIGPRLTLQPIKIFSEPMKGNVLFRSYDKPMSVKDSAAFIAKQKKAVRRPHQREAKIMKKLKLQMNTNENAMVSGEGAGN
jgi:ribosome biogenesis protein BRX1